MTRSWPPLCATICLKTSSSTAVVSQLFSTLNITECRESGLILVSFCFVFLRTETFTAGSITKIVFPDYAAGSVKTSSKRFGFDCGGVDLDQLLDDRDRETPTPRKASTFEAKTAGRCFYRVDHGSLHFFIKICQANYLSLIESYRLSDSEMYSGFFSYGETGIFHSSGNLNTLYRNM